MLEGQSSRSQEENAAKTLTAKYPKKENKKKTKLNHFV